jgi:segregation and condensation protein B
MTLPLAAQLESILFVASKPLSSKQCSEALEISLEEVKEVFQQLKNKYEFLHSGIVILETNEEWYMTTHPENNVLAEKFLKAEISGELTKPQLETLTVISYCGPITKAELEHLRGVNCSMILRNLMMRGLVKESEGVVELLPAYEVTLEYLRYLGIERVEDLPRYQEFHTHEFVAQTLVSVDE